MHAHTHAHTHVRTHTHTHTHSHTHTHTHTHTHRVHHNNKAREKKVRKRYNSYVHEQTKTKYLKYMKWITHSDPHIKNKYNSNRFGEKGILALILFYFLIISKANVIYLDRFIVLGSFSQESIYCAHYSSLVGLQTPWRHISRVSVSKLGTETGSGPRLQANVHTLGSYSSQKFRFETTSCGFSDHTP